MTPDVLIIGGGLHGLSAALNCARRGAKVSLVERHFVGRHASGSTAAGVRTLGRDIAELPLSLEAAALWHEMETLVGDDCGFTGCGQLQLAEDEAALASMKARVSRLRDMGHTHEEVIGRDTLRELLPDVSHHCLGGAWVPTDGSADPHRTIGAFRSAAERAGVVIYEQCEVTALQRGSGTWRAETSKGIFETKTLVNAAGAWAERICELAGDPVRHAIRTSMMVVTERTSTYIGPVVSSLGRKLSFKQTGQGTLLIGGGSQGKLSADRQSASVDVIALAASVKAALRLFPATQGLRIVRAWAGMEAMTSDHLPVIGFSGRVEGLIHAFGFSGHGFQLVPSVGRVLADLVCEGKTTKDLGAFEPLRTATRGVAA
ncbi:NAD(P)/FAD-dependent oxidoreductase [Agrobacterium vaccinii]|uniref:NAD(P)/FAD-dependent oxidoreductase n=1 Tax=Agrobacterium vaccinii TaxID=2735528 RepID=UPI001E475067|nr:FAD-dependent oxidoreductase [Agrobacterium vaccinii]UHS59815.1 FAD-binding oxidoreductase [Agrobacterium vaccinii]